MDALSDVLAAVRLTSNAFLDARFTAPWCIAARVGPEDCAALGAMPAQVIAYHHVVAGRMFVDLEGRQAVEVNAGEIVLLPRNDRHTLGSALGLPAQVVDHLIQPPDGARPAVLRLGGGGACTELVCGFLGCEMPQNPLLAALPAVLTLNTGERAPGAWLGDSFRRAAAEFASGGIGSATALGKLAELLFIDAVRGYVARLPEHQAGWLAGLRDRVVGRSLALIHASTDRAWTTGELARESGLSRSAFAERFAAFIGMPPMRYLARWRLQVAALRLRETQRSSAQIASEVGYESEAAFARAFRRAFGVTPGAWRRRHDRRARAQREPR